MPSYSSQADGSFIIKEGDKEVRFSDSILPGLWLTLVV
jgi:hypothetical protein